MTVNNPMAPIPDDVLRALQRLGLTPFNFEAEVRRLREFKQRAEDDLNAAGVSFGMVARTVEEREAEILRLEEKALALRHDRDYWHQRATDAEMGVSA